MRCKSYKILLCSILFPLYVFAQEVRVNNVWYVLDFSTQTATIRGLDSTHHDPQLKIPPYIQHQEQAYKVVKVGTGAFERNDYLQRIDLPNTIISIDSFAFMSCSHLESIRIRGNVSSIGTAAFGWCPRLKKLVLPTNITYIPELMCFNCSSLETIIIPQSVIDIESQAFQGCTKLRNVQLPNGLKTIHFFAFRDCTNLRRVEIPHSVDSIKSLSFAGCERLRYVHLGAPKRIQNGAFKWCGAIRKIKVATSTPPRMLIINEELPFDSCVSNAKVIVPRGSIDDYRQARGWDMFSNYHESRSLTH